MTRSIESAAERGSALVDFVLVGTLLALTFISIVQLALVLHVRNTIIDAAASGARYGSLADRAPEDGVNRTRELIGSALNPDFAQDVGFSRADVSGIPVLRITVRAPLPVIGLLGPAKVLEVNGHAALQP